MTVNIKRIHDLTWQEAAALTPKQVQRYIDVEIALEGVVPVDEPERPQLEEVTLEPKVTAYRVNAGYSSGSLWFTDMRAVEKVVGIKPMVEKYDYDAGSNYHWLEPLVAEDAITTKRFYDRDEVQAMLAKLRRNEELMRPYKAQQSEYDRYVSATEKIRRSVWGIVNAAKERDANIKGAHKVFADYVELTEGNQEIAERLFRKNFADDPELIEVVLGTASEEAPTETTKSDEG